MTDTPKTVLEAFDKVVNRQASTQATTIRNTPVRMEALVEFYRKFLTKHGYDDRNPEMHTAVAQMLAGAFAGTTKKGLLFLGCAGSGKTMGLTIAVKYLAGCIHRAPIIADTLARKTAMHLRRVTQFDWQRPQDCLLDDLGDEDMLNDFGVKRETMGEFVTERYCRAFQENGALTHVTTNYTEDALVARYGERVVSRLHEMCIWIGTGTVDWRKECHR